MGKKSVKLNKTIYQLCREEKGLTREQAAELLDYISSDRIEKIENERSEIRPDEVLAMAKAYKAPQLCNYYCSHECEIGKEFVPEVESKDLSRIILEMISTLNSINKEKDRLIDIAADGEISEDEYADFFHIKKELSRVSLSVDALHLWIDTAIAEGRIDSTASEKYEQ